VAVDGAEETEVTLLLKEGGRVCLEEVGEELLGREVVVVNGELEVEELMKAAVEEGREEDKVSGLLN